MRLVVVVFLFVNIGLWAQDETAVAKMVADPKTVADFFVSCPYLSYSPDEDGIPTLNTADRLKKPVYQGALHQRLKALLVQGVPVDYRYPLNGLAIDLTRNRLHFGLAGEDLTMQVFQGPGKARTVAVRVSDFGGESPDSHWSAWAIFNVADGKWRRIMGPESIPMEWVGQYFTNALTARDQDFLSLVSWDLELPQAGPAWLIPQQKVPNASRKVHVDDYLTWDQSHFGTGPERRSLQLAWDKGTDQLVPGLVSGRAIPKPKYNWGREIGDVLKRPENVWEYYLACPELVADTDRGMVWSPTDHSEVEGWASDQLVQKQNLLWDGLGNGYSLVDAPKSLVIDLPNGFFHFYAQETPPPLHADDSPRPPTDFTTLDFTLVYFEKADKTRVVAYRFWGADPRGASAPHTEYNQLAASFSTVIGNEWTGLNDADILPMDRINSLALGKADEKDQALQQAIIWDVDLPQFGTTIHLVPWSLETQTPEKMARLKTLFGSPAEVNKAFAKFVARWYGGKALALKWNKAAGTFDPPALESWSPK